MNQLVVRLPREQKIFLEFLAIKQKTTVSSLTRIAINDFLNKKKSSSLFSRLAKIGKRAKTKQAPKDLSTNYKKYLY